MCVLGNLNVPRACRLLCSANDRAAVVQRSGPIVPVFEQAQEVGHATVGSEEMRRVAAPRAAIGERLALARKRRQIASRSWSQRARRTSFGIGERVVVDPGVRQQRDGVGDDRRPACELSEAVSASWRCNFPARRPDSRPRRSSPRSAGLVAPAMPPLTSFSARRKRTGRLFARCLGFRRWSR